MLLWCFSIKSLGKNVIMVFFNKITRYAHFCALAHPFSASIVVSTFMDTFQKLHGNPKVIVSDRDPIFTRKFGLNYFLFWVPSWLTIHLIILNLMGKIR